MATRSSKTDATESVTEPGPTPAVALERNARITLHATILRVDGPWVQLSILGEVQHVLRSRLERELSNGC